MTSDPVSTTGARECARKQEYVDNGVQLGWLIEPKIKIVEIYRSTQIVEILNNPPSLLGEEILPGFILDLGEILSN